MLLLLVCLAGFVSSSPLTSDARNQLINSEAANMQLASGASSEAMAKQFEGSEDNLKLEAKIARGVSYLIAPNVKAIHQKEDIEFDKLYNRTHHTAHRFISGDCSQAPNCTALNRKSCFTTNNTCGTCKMGFYGSPGDSNDPCVAVDCSRAPDCEELNRYPCSSIPQTCGACFEDFYAHSTEWSPKQRDLSAANDPCFAIQYRPIVFVHGLGDTFRGLATNYPASLARRTFHTLKTFSAEPGGGVFSATKPLADMVEEFVEEVRSIPGLKKGFNLVGVSQGGLIARAFVEKYNDPPVYNLVSFHAPMSGVQQCPGNQVSSIPSQMAIWYGMVTPHDYWRGADHNGLYSKETYLSWKNFLQDINNEGEVKNETYKEHMTSLHNYILVKAMKDQVVRPAESEWHGYQDWLNPKKILTMEETEEYQNDAIGLKTLKESKRLHRYSTPGGHIQASAEFWEQKLYPFFDNGWFQDDTPFDLQHYMQSEIRMGRS